ncbi:hypothetical protein FB451DRAFT_1166490 [Mycena latifolia]|nr:hypothetical protein FB451DRAFT_1166490 [Mycena latifolia]
MCKQHPAAGCQWPGTPVYYAISSRPSCSVVLHASMGGLGPTPQAQAANVPPSCALRSLVASGVRENLSHTRTHLAVLRHCITLWCARRRTRSCAQSQLDEFESLSDSESPGIIRSLRGGWLRRTDERMNERGSGGYHNINTPVRRQRWYHALSTRTQPINYLKCCREKEIHTLHALREQGRRLPPRRGNVNDGSGERRGLRVGGSRSLGLEALFYLRLASEAEYSVPMRPDVGAAIAAISVSLLLRSLVESPWSAEPVYHVYGVSSKGLRGGKKKNTSLDVFNLKTSEVFI